jgi:hypothetical protein
MRPHEVNMTLARAMGLSIENLISFSISCKPSGFPVVQAEYLVLGDEGIKTVTETYRLRLEAKEAA